MTKAQSEGGPAPVLRAAIRPALGLEELLELLVEHQLLEEGQAREVAGRATTLRSSVLKERVGSVRSQAAARYDAGQSCGAEANAAKYLAAEAGHNACQTAILTLGGMGYSREYRVERLLRESYIPRIAPVSPQLIMCFIAERVLGLPKSY